LNESFCRIEILFMPHIVVGRHGEGGPIFLKQTSKKFQTWWASHSRYRSRFFFPILQNRSRRGFQVSPAAAEVEMKFPVHTARLACCRRTTYVWTIRYSSLNAAKPFRASVAQQVIQRVCLSHLGCDLFQSLDAHHQHSGACLYEGAKYEKPKKLRLTNKTRWAYCQIYAH
jgi:hypothetical protein